MALISKNENLPFVRAMASYDIDIDDTDFPLFILFCTLFVANGDQSILHGKPDNMVKSLTEFCESERLEGAKAKRNAPKMIWACFC